MIRDTAANVCPTHDAGSGCRSEVTRSVWDGAQLLADVRQPADTLNGADGGTGSGPFAGTVTYTHGGGIDAPLALAKAGTVVVPLATWDGRYDRGTCPVVACETSTSVYFPLATATVFGDATLPPGGPPSWYGELLSDQTDGSGYHYKRNRYYDPVQGRFTQEDPLGLAGGLNAYGFAAGDPVAYDDPFGLCKDSRGRDLPPVQCDRALEQPLVDPISIAAGFLTGFARGMLLRASTRALVGAADQSTGPVAVLQVDPNKLRHIFANTAHNLGTLVEHFGSEEAVFNEVQAAVQSGVRQLTEIFETTVSIADQNVVVRGRVIDGIVRIGTFFIK